MRPLLWMNLALLPVFWLVSASQVGYGIYVGVLVLLPYVVLSAVALAIAKSRDYVDRTVFAAVALGAAIIWLALIQFALAAVAFGMLVFALPSERWRPAVVALLGVVLVAVAGLQATGLFDDETYSYPQRVFAVLRDWKGWSVVVHATLLAVTGTLVSRERVCKAPR